MEFDKSVWVRCRTLIEEKLGWGDGRQWTNADFELLGEKIRDETGVSLSTSTLKRLWGRVRYDSTPQVATLNALARFAGYGTFRELAEVHEKAESKSAAALAHPKSPAVPGQPSRESGRAQRQFSKSAMWSIGLVMGISISLFLAFSLSQKQKNAPLATAHYSFSSRPVTTGLPNSVVFTFDVSQAKTDCLFVQQTWDDSKRFRIRKNQQQATSIYYYPGFFTAKLTVDSTVVSQHQLFIKTDGWLPLVEQEPVPVYFKPEESTRNGVFGLTDRQLMSHNITMQPKVPHVLYFYMKDFGDLSSDNFILETSVKNTFSTGSGACQQSQVAVHCENGLFVVPLSVPGCTSALNALIPGKLIQGSKTDLSKFGVDFARWAELRIAVKNKNVVIYLNEKPVLKTAFSMNAGKVIGVGYSFQGTGLVDYVRLSDGKGKVALAEEF
ncbi:hypothetical protein [Salmonirosea aquatica]|uniref:PKD domain-containing protein n=1 Tax=Salmonirosea aquatica TaxID=2654236 RepID=A0A7C9BFS1_9BACT|nr:hypothetical protein [Cytophagaceae bacterium SJW1-29]